MLFCRNILLMTDIWRLRIAINKLRTLANAGRCGLTNHRHIEYSFAGRQRIIFNYNQLGLYLMLDETRLALGCNWLHLMLDETWLYLVLGETRWDIIYSKQSSWTASRSCRNLVGISFSITIISKKKLERLFTASRAYRDLVDNQLKQPPHSRYKVASRTCRDREHHRGFEGSKCICIRGYNFETKPIRIPMAKVTRIFLFGPFDVDRGSLLWESRLNWATIHCTKFCVSF